MPAARRPSPRRRGGRNCKRSPRASSAATRGRPVPEGIPGLALPPGQAAGVDHTAYYTPSQAAYCSGTHVAEVEVDAMTGGVKVVTYSVAHDSGRVINPLIVDGQVQGGVAHGVGN